MPRPRALITGRSGFTGRYVESELQAAGYEVFGLTSIVEGREVPIDLLDRKAVHEVVHAIGPVVVLHLAAIAFVAHDDVDAIYQVNVIGTRHLLEALASLEEAPRIVVLASSANIYGNADVEPITETTPPAPTNDYAVSKLAMEYIARLWMDRLPIVITRPFNYTGVGQAERFLVPKIVAHFKARKDEIELGNLNVVRDFSDVRFIAKAYCEILRRRPVGKIINLCSGVGHSLSSILDTLRELTHHDIRVLVNRDFVRTGEVARLIGSNAELKKNCPGVDDITLKSTLEWMLSTK